MLSARRIFAILGIGAVLIASELVFFHSLNHSLDRFAKGLEIVVQRLNLFLDIVSASSNRQTVANPQGFHWDWKSQQELKADQSLRNAKLPQQTKSAISKVIAEQIRPAMGDLEIKSETELRKTALETRIRLIDLNNDGTPEVVAQGVVGCGASGNCPFWVFQKLNREYEVLLQGYAQTFTIQGSSTNGFRDIVLSVHGSYSSGGLTNYRYQDGVYKDMGCYTYEWVVLEGETERELKEPRITPCR